MTQFGGDSNEILFTSDRSGKQEIHRIDLSSRDTSRPTDNPARDEHPAWSPSRDAIAFTTDRDGMFHIYWMDPDGSNQGSLSNGIGLANDYEATWSPDGQRWCRSPTGLSREPSSAQGRWDPRWGGLMV